MRRPRLLDAFSCQGGATRGYQRAGFHVTALDNNAERAALNPADDVVVADAVEFIREQGWRFDAIHTSPPCQRDTRGNVANDTSDYPDLIGPTREALLEAGVPYVIENVTGARHKLIDPILLCGKFFGLTAVDDDGTVLHLQRHRYFESNVPLTAPRHTPDPRALQWAGAYGGARRDKVEARTIRKGGYVPPSLAVLRELLGIDDDLMTEQGLFECIPPAYAEHIGRQLATPSHSCAATPSPCRSPTSPSTSSAPARRTSASGPTRTAANTTRDRSGRRRPRPSS
jgi:DNA (cytosine-5)-methyltransferase 1